MHQTYKLSNGLTLITINLPHLDSVTSLIAVPAGSRYETKKINGISHFLEHMFFKGSKKYPTTQEIANIIDGIGAINNAATSKEYTYYYVKSAAKHLELASDILSSMLKESLLQPEEIEREKEVVIEELRMLRDNPARYIWDLYEMLQFGDQPLGWDIGGDEETLMAMKRDDFVQYIDSLYDPEKMALVYAGNVPKDIVELAEKYFGDLPKRSHFPPVPFHHPTQDKPRVNIKHKATDQANIILGVEAFDRKDPRRYPARLMGMILGEGMSSRLFIQVRERRGLAYSVHAGHDPFMDTGTFIVYAGLKLEKVEEGIKVIKDELEKLVSKPVTAAELKKVKEMERGRIALRSESTNFLAEHFGTEFILDGEIETFDDYMAQIDKVTPAQIQKVAREIIKPERYNLQIIAPLKDPKPFEEILKS